MLPGNKKNQDFTRVPSPTTTEGYMVMKLLAMGGDQVEDSVGNMRTTSQWPYALVCIGNTCATLQWLKGYLCPNME